jgi:very-short-patch-repair endonuclease
METVNSRYLGKRLGFKNTDFTRKCRIYCSNLDIEVDQYLVMKGMSVTFDLPIHIAVGVVENVRMHNPNRTRVLEELYSKLGARVTTQLPQRKEIVFITTLQQLLAELGVELIPQYPVNQYCLDGYIPSLNIMVEFDEYEHAYNKEQDELREFSIKLALPHGLRIVRIPEDTPLGTALGKVVALR